MDRNVSQFTNEDDNNSVTIVVNGAIIDEEGNMLLSVYNGSELDCTALPLMTSTVVTPEEMVETMIALTGGK